MIKLTQHAEHLGIDERGRMWVLALPGDRVAATYLTAHECLHLAQGHSTTAREAIEAGDAQAVRWHSTRAAQMVAAAGKLDPSAPAMLAEAQNPECAGHA